ncbi:glycosyl hydrolase family 18 protein [Stenotrophomonas rhizophila]|uniref:glycosyl hydrolase family 18 protein n=1 Tax=Stenotrophomonas rhizophila TaxID=216778 RepID=UPI001E35A47C|nr:glycosyl hydrolase family 18 protein [Stenotrophomonas rhizophila]MCC7634043.1 chitinase [Stenotrophomonas rhizophila]MCC7662739.1 chitinase [Stenotrophomonas rhizophila]
MPDPIARSAVTSISSLLPVPRRRWGLLLALAAAASLPGLAQAANCTGVAEWNPAVIYLSGTTLQKGGVLYRANQDIWNAPPDHPAGAPYYTNLGACDGGAGNQPPSVALTSPTAGASFSAGSTITLSANAADSDGSVSKVEFFRGGTSLGIDTSAPYSVAWANAVAGSHTLKAVATDNNNAVTSSATVAITVTAPSNDTTAPSVPGGLASPAHTASTVNLAWNAATDNTGGSGVAGYDVYRNGSLVGSPAATQYTDGGLAPSTAYSYTVRARDNAGNASARSTAISVTTAAGGGGGAKRVIGYFTQWGIYGRNYRVKNIDTSGSAARLTHINYAFGNVRNNRCEVGITQPSDANTGAGGDAFADYTKAFGAGESVSGGADSWDQPLRGNWNQLKQLKAKHPNVKVLISLGGWTWSRGFSSAAQPAHRQAFVASCVDAYIKGNLPVTDGAGGVGAAAGVFDGIDIDWEYPVACGLSCGSAADNANYTALLAEFRRQLDAVRPGLLLTVAVGAGIDKVRVTDPAAYHPYLDFINVMTYDFHGAWDAQTNHHSALFDSPADPSTGDQKLYNSNDAMEAFISRGVPAGKLNLGIGYYGRGWTGVASGNNGLYRSASGAAPGTYEAGIEDWKVLKNLAWPGYTDPVAKATWISNGSTFWSFDTPAMVTEKMGYVKAQGLGGAFFWEFSGDDAQGTLTKAIRDGLN